MKTKTCINLDEELMTALREYSKESEIPITRLVVRGIRCVLNDRTPKPIPSGNMPNGIVVAAEPMPVVVEAQTN